MPQWLVLLSRLTIILGPVSGALSDRTFRSAPIQVSLHIECQVAYIGSEGEGFWRGVICVTRSYAAGKLA